MCSAENISDLLPHVCPNNEVDDEVRWGVDHHEDVGDVSEQDGPDREASHDGYLYVKTVFDLLQGPDLVDIEQQPRKMTDEEGQHDEDENDTKRRLLLLFPLPEFDDFFVNSHVENWECYER